jgi:magnesium transporter
MVFSLYGMNFHWMPELSWKFSYPVIMLLVVTGCTWLYRRLRHVGWL